MTLTENFIQNVIHLDAGAEVMYGSDQIYDTYRNFGFDVKYLDRAYLRSTKED